MKKRIVIIGGCAAGPKVAAKSRRMDSETDILLFTKSKRISYSACGLPYYVKGVINDINKLVVRTPEDFENKNVKIFLNHECTKIIPENKQVLINNKLIHYDELVLATGAMPFCPKIKNLNLDNVFYLRVLEDGIKIKEKMKKSKSVLIIGFGYIALEMLEAFLTNGLKVIITENNSHIMSFLDSEISDIIEKRIIEKYSDSVRIIKNDYIEEFIGESDFQGALTHKGLRINTDFCLVSTGVRPNVKIAQDCGIKTGITGGIVVNDKMQTNIEHIWAAGDCTQKHCLITGLPVYSALGSVANKEGRVCAVNLNGGDERFPGVLGSSITKFFDYTVSITGMTEKRAEIISKKIGINPISSAVTKLDKASYMPDAKEITLKIVADKLTGKILGAQGIGEGDVDKRINVVTSALQKRMTIDEFMHLDLTYMPETSGVIDPLLTLCYELKKQMD